MKHLYKYMKGYEKECLLGPLFKLLEAGFELLIPLIVAKIVDQGILGGSGGYIIKLCLCMIFLGAIGLVCSVTAQFFAAKAAVGFSSKLRHALMEHILQLGYSEIDRLGTSSMITRMTSDMNQVQSGVNLALRLLLRSPFVVFGAMVMAFTIDFHAALVFLAVIPVLCLVVFGIMLITMPMYKRVQGKLDCVTGATRENLAGVRVLRAFCKEEDEISTFYKKTDSLTQEQVKAGRISGLLNPVTLVIINLAIVVLIQVGALKVEHGVLTQGLVIALYNYMSQILAELIKMANLIITMTKAAACAHRIDDLLQVQVSQQGGTNREPITGQVEFQNVSARYPGAASNALQDISFFVAPGQTIGVIGGTGSGKTTLVNMIPRLYDAFAGTVLLDGKDIRTYSLSELHKQIAVVPQKSSLFHGTIRENLLWGNPDADDDQLWSALETAQARELVKGRVGELNAVVEQEGSNFSGGQRQRLTIARALVRKPKILILDDSASALDYATDARLRKAIGEIKTSLTTFIVSQRAASVRSADLILVLEDGKMAGCGTHEELMQGCSVYQEIYYSQFSKEEGTNG